MSYPKFLKSDPRTQLLLDIGYSYALIEKTREIFHEIVKSHYPGLMSENLHEMIKAIEEFQTNRLQLVAEVYDSAEGALTIDQRLGALDKILAEAEWGYDDAPEGLRQAIAEAQKLYERK